MAGTQFEEGLRNRRNAEANVFLNADYNYKEMKDALNSVKDVVNQSLTDIGMDIICHNTTKIE